MSKLCAAVIEDGGQHGDADRTKDIKEEHSESNRSDENESDDSEENKSDSSEDNERLEQRNDGREVESTDNSESEAEDDTSSGYGTLGDSDLEDPLVDRHDARPIGNHDRPADLIIDRHLNLVESDCTVSLIESINAQYDMKHIKLR